ncbi:membrane protein [Borreliella burgdorferi 29805]|nr:membrane protein [Borreliella burgdorferi 29805]
MIKKAVKKRKEGNMLKDLNTNQGLKPWRVESVFIVLL